MFCFIWGKWFFNYQVEYIHHYLFRMLVGALSYYRKSVHHFNLKK